MLVTKHWYKMDGLWFRDGVGINWFTKIVVDEWSKLFRAAVVDESHVNVVGGLVHANYVCS